MMKNFIVFTATVLSSFSLAIAGVRNMRPGDPNLDANWDWKSSSMQSLYSSAVGESPASSHFAFSPFFSPDNPLNSVPLDNNTEDGWVLVHRDFGAPEMGQPFPFFTMYNRYRGTFRVMLFNALMRDESFYVGRLRFMNSGTESRSTSLLNFSSTSRCYLNDFDPNCQISAISYMKAFGDWAVFDFPLAGYDPSLNNSDPILTFSLSGVDSKKLKSSGNASIDLVQQIESKSARPGFGISDIKQAVDTGLNFYRAPLNWMEELTNQKNKSQRWYSTAMNLSKTAVASYVPWIAALGGIVESFIGGSKKAAQWEPLRFNGQMKFDFQGNILLERGLWAHNFYLKTGPQSTMAQRPLQDVSWGVFNIQSPPVLVEEDCPIAGIHYYYYMLQSGGEIVVNPDAGLELTSTEAAVKFDRKYWEYAPIPPKPGEPPLDPETDTSYFDSTERFTKVGILRLWKPAKPVAVIYKLTFKTRQPTLYSDNEIVMMKTVNIESPVSSRPWKF
jgi:hypothetical protein